MLLFLDLPDFFIGLLGLLGLLLCDIYCSSSLSLPLSSSLSVSGSSNNLLSSLSYSKMSFGDFLLLSKFSKFSKFSKVSWLFWLFWFNKLILSKTVLELFLFLVLFLPFFFLQEFFFGFVNRLSNVS